MIGIVKSVRADRGFAFLNGEDGLSYFLHASQLAGGSPALDSLAVGASVSFDPQPSERGPRAANAKLV